MGFLLVDVVAGDGLVLDYRMWIVIGMWLWIIGWTVGTVVYMS